VGVRDDQGRQAGWTDTFLVAAPDTARMGRVAGEGARTVAFDSAKVWVAWQGDAARFDSVWIDGILVLPVKGVWGTWVEPAPGSKVSVDLRAKTADGIWIEDRVEVARLARQPAPSLVPLPGSRHRILPFDSTEALVGWQEDRGEVDSVWIDGRLAQRLPNGVYQRDLDLSGIVGTREVVVVARRGDLRFRDSVQVERRPDTIAPVIVPGAARFAFEGDSILVEATWVVTDNDSVDSVRIGDRAVDRIGNTFSRAWRIDPARRSVEIQAKDRSGNVSRKDLDVPRMVDTVGPVLRVLPATVSRTVPADTTSVLVGWRVSDDRLLKSVWIDDSLVTGQGGIFASQVPLATGRNIIRAKAMDAAGNVAWDSIEIRREPSAGLRMYRDLPTLADSVVNQADSVVEVAYFATSPARIDTMRIGNGAATRDPDGEYRSQVSLAIGVNRIPVLAVDRDGNRKVDTVRVRRRDQTRPLLVRQNGTANRTVDSSMASLVVAWKVTDNVAVKRVLINGTEVAPTGDI
ncbi:MAG TPA: hypothetical protein PKY05_18730, partial [Fibrobacteria bacterium]|nr:hypothetical protein [Fibrobacteria bacterium]